jgi:hypothetical protein
LATTAQRWLTGRGYGRQQCRQRKADQLGGWQDNILSTGHDHERNSAVHQRKVPGHGEDRRLLGAAGMRHAHHLSTLPERSLCPGRYDFRHRLAVPHKRSCIDLLPRFASTGTDSPVSID